MRISSYEPHLATKMIDVIIVKALPRTCVFGLNDISDLVILQLVDKAGGFAAAFNILLCFQPAHVPSCRLLPSDDSVMQRVWEI